MDRKDERKVEVHGMEYTVRMTWDSEASVWVAESDDILGLVMEGGSIDALIERVRFAAPELLALNKQQPCDSILFLVEKREKVPA